MATELHWPRRATFIEAPSQGVDDQAHHYEGPATYEVPDDSVDHYLERGWIRPEDADAGDDAPAAVEQDEPAEPADADADAEPDDGFDAEAFVDQSWQAVTAAIEDGDADGHLDDVRDAERDRDDGDPRDSVLEALDERAG
jgi:hypothetical protein